MKIFENIKDFFFQAEGEGYDDTDDMPKYGSMMPDSDGIDASSSSTGDRRNKVVNINATAKLQVGIFKPERFGEETRKIREAFRTAISSSGYIVRIIDEKEHNNHNSGNIGCSYRCDKCIFIKL